MHLIKNDEKHLFVSYVNDVNNGYSNSHVMSSSHDIFSSPISTVCGQYCIALMFRCRNISMHAFARLFTSDLNANDCRVFG